MKMNDREIASKIYDAIMACQTETITAHIKGSYPNSMNPGQEKKETRIKCLNKIMEIFDDYIRSEGNWTDATVGHQG